MQNSAKLLNVEMCSVLIKKLFKMLYNILSSIDIVN